MLLVLVIYLAPECEMTDALGGFGLGAGCGSNHASFALSPVQCLAVALAAASSSCDRPPALRPSVSSCDFWLTDHHLLLYPNPYPKPRQRGRRWHFHASLPLLLALGGSLEVRCPAASLHAPLRRKLHSRGPQKKRCGPTGCPTCSSFAPPCRRSHPPSRLAPSATPSTHPTPTPAG